MKSLLAFVFVVLLSCNNNSDKTDNEKVETESKIEIKTDSAEIKINEGGISVQSSDDGKDSVEIKINEKDGIKIEGKDGKVEMNTDNGGKLKIEKKGKNININIKEN